MAVTDFQYQALLGRVSTLERAVSDLMVAIRSFVTNNQVHQLSTTLQTDIADLQSRVTGLEQQLELFTNEVGN